MADDATDDDEQEERNGEYVSPDEAERSPEYYDHAEQYSRSRVMRGRR